MEPWDDARMTAFAALLTNARILELEKLVDERNGRIVHLEETRDELECQVYDVQRRLDKANVRIEELRGADNEAAREE